MSIRDKISDEIKTAMKAKDKERLATLRLIKNEIMKVETGKGAGEVDEQGFVKVLMSMKKQRLDSIQQYEAGGRQELADRERAEIDVLESFLPKSLSDVELNDLVRAVLADLGISEMREMGKAIKEVMARAAGGADGGRISGAVKAALSS